MIPLMIAAVMVSAPLMAARGTRTYLRERRVWRVEIASTDSHLRLRWLARGEQTSHQIRQEVEQAAHLVREKHRLADEHRRFEEASCRMREMDDLVHQMRHELLYAQMMSEMSEAERREWELFERLTGKTSGGDWRDQARRVRNPRQHAPQGLRNLAHVAGADERAIKRAYRQLAATMHPDVSDEPNATERFVELTEEYDQLIARLAH